MEACTCFAIQPVVGGQEISYKQKKLGSIELDVDMCWVSLAPSCWVLEKTWRRWV
jgi:hypothetical protein